MNACFGCIITICDVCDTKIFFFLEARRRTISTIFGATVSKCVFQQAGATTTVPYRTPYVLFFRNPQIDVRAWFNFVVWALEVQQ